MRISHKFGTPTVIIDRIHYFPNQLEDTGLNVDAVIAVKRDSQWIKEMVKITKKQSEEIKQYAEKYK